MLKKILKRQRLKYPILTNVVLERIHLFGKLYKGSITALETARLSFLVGMMTEDDYVAFLKNEKEYGTQKKKS